MIRLDVKRNLIPHEQLTQLNYDKHNTNPVCGCHFCQFHLHCNLFVWWRTKYSDTVEHKKWTLHSNRIIVHPGVQYFHPPTITIEKEKDHNHFVVVPLFFAVIIILFFARRLKSTSLAVQGFNFYDYFYRQEFIIA